MLRIEYADYEGLRAHGEETYPNECCGVLLGKNIAGEGDGGAAMNSAAAVNKVQQIVRAGNTRTDSAHNRYNIAPTDFAEAHWLGCSYVITSVEQGKAATTNSFLLRGTGEDDKKFEDEAIQIDIPANVAAPAAHNQKGSA